MPAINKPTLSPFQKKQRMSLSQTYYLAHTARGKLSKEASRADHDLRLLVGHANLLDGLMLDLADAEREQESWFNQTVRDASSPKKAEPKHITWADDLTTVTEDEAESDSDSDEVDEDEMIVVTATTARRTTSATTIDLDSDEEEDEEEDEDEDDAGLQLVRTPSRSSPPELTHGHESESDSEDDDMPLSPPAPHMEFAQTANAKKQETLRMEHEEALYEDGFYLPPRPQAIVAY